MLILYDGACHLCQRSIRFVAGRDPSARFAFAPLQSALARRLLSGVPGIGTDSVVLVEGGQVYTRSTAALRIARRLTFPWNLLYAFVLAPAVVRDPVYDCLARNRYRWFGRSDVCQLPAPDLLARMAPGALDDIEAP